MKEGNKGGVVTSRGGKVAKGGKETISQETRKDHQVRRDFRKQAKFGIRSKKYFKSQGRKKVSIPRGISASNILSELSAIEVGAEHFSAVKEMSDYADENLSRMLGIDVRTFRKYKNSKTKLKLREADKEKVLVLMTVYNHGIEVLGEKKDFSNWLEEENFYFDNKKPVNFMGTISGLQFVDNVLTGMEYGDNA